MHGCPLLGVQVVDGEHRHRLFTGPHQIHNETVARGSSGLPSLAFLRKVRRGLRACPCVPRATSCELSPAEAAAGPSPSPAMSDSRATAAMSDSPATPPEYSIATSEPTSELDDSPASRFHGSADIAGKNATARNELQTNVTVLAHKRLCNMFNVAPGGHYPSGANPV